MRINGYTVPDCQIQAIGAYPNKVQDTLLAVRELIFAVKNGDSEIGQLEEALRWGELSYLTEKPRTGSIIRLAITKSGEPALFFHCGTTLVETYRSQYSHVFEFEGNRAMVIRMPVEDTIAELTHCIKQALRYHLDARCEVAPYPLPVLTFESDSLSNLQLKRRQSEY